MADDEPPAGQYGGPFGGQGNPWEVPGAPGAAPFGAAPEYPPPRRSRTLIWISAVVVVVLLAASGVGAFILGTRHHSGPSASAAAAASSPPASGTSSAPHTSPSPPSTPPSSAPSSSLSSPSAAAPSTAQPTTPAAGAPGNAPGPLDQYLLAPTEVGASSMMFLIDGGRSTTNQPTLDWCNFTYTSEASRAARVQVEYTGNNSLPAGNEFVHYQRGGTARAWAEIQRAVATCPPTSTTDGYINDLVELAPPDSALVARQIVLSYHVTDPTGQLNLPWQAVVYQFDGDYFSGIYVYGLSRSLALTEAQRLAAKSAIHLAQASRGKPGTGGGPMQSVTSSPPNAGVQD